jgi:NAD(P)-dependent dehydrogenase (short-subunit alcohol dehydrogenase family)
MSRLLGMSPDSHPARRRAPKPELSVRGKVVMVTGASSGLGAALAAELALRGARVALVARTTEALERVAAGLPGEHAWFEGDVTSDASIEKAVAGIVERFGRIDVVLANAGVVKYGSVAVQSSADFAAVLDTNVTGVYRTVKAALPALRESKGYLLVSSSISTVIAAGGMASYASSKVALEHLAHVLRLELHREGIGVGTLYASWIDTPMISSADAEMPSFRRLRRVWELPARVPLVGRYWPGGMVSPQECAIAVVDAVERRQRRVWVPLTVWGLSMIRMGVNSRPGERIQIALLGKSSQKIDADLQES